MRLRKFPTNLAKHRVYLFKKKIIHLALLKALEYILTHISNVVTLQSCSIWVLLCSGSDFSSAKFCNQSLRHVKEWNNSRLSASLGITTKGWGMSQHIQCEGVYLHPNMGRMYLYYNMPTIQIHYHKGWYSQKGAGLMAIPIQSCNTQCVLAWYDSHQYGRGKMLRQKFDTGWNNY